MWGSEITSLVSGLVQARTPACIRLPCMPLLLYDNADFFCRVSVLVVPSCEQVLNVLMRDAA